MRPSTAPLAALAAATLAAAVVTSPAAATSAASAKGSAEVVLSSAAVTVAALAGRVTATAHPSEPRAAAAAVTTAAAAPSVSLTQVRTGLDSPTDVASPPGSDDLYVTEQPGRVRVLHDGTLSTAVDLRGVVLAGGEQGLLALAFHPRFASNGRLFVYYTRETTGDIAVDEVRLENRHYVTGSRRAVLRIRHRQAANHNGGDLVFGRGGALYISTGDGGGAGNEFGHAQDPHSLLGKILRIDVDHGRPYTIPAGNPLTRRQGRREVWALGLRNPWRMSLDPATGRLWVGDVGQNQVEEVDRLRTGKRPLLNLGWSRYEGRRTYDAGERLRGGRLVFPVTTYRHPQGSSIIGGAVYRGPQAALQHFYVYGDLDGWIAGFDLRDHSRRFRIAPGSTLLTISRAAGGELYAAYADGTLWRVVAS